MTNLKQIRRLWLTIIAWGTISNLIFFSVSASAGPSPFEVLGVEAVAVSDEEMADIRGGYAGFYFAFDFSGYWENTSGSAADASATYHTDLGDVNVVVNGNTHSGDGGGPVSSQSTMNMGDKVVRMKAFVGDINYTQGAIQITQVPGSNNVVTTVMNLQFTVININDPSKVGQLSEILSGVYGN